MKLLARDPLFDFDRLFDGFYRPTAAVNDRQTLDSNVYSPRVDVRELEHGYELIAELPGIGKENISVTVEESTLTIEANNETSVVEEQDGTYLRKERHAGKYLRSFKLGRDIDSSQIEASFRDGLLLLKVPKAKQQTTQQRIEIH